MHHICHHQTLNNKSATHLCRGARDFQLQIFHRLGLLEEPTDECWGKTSQEFMSLSK